MVYIYQNSTGLIVPDTQNLLAQTQSEYKAALGQDTVMTPDTPQGMLSTADTLVREADTQNNAAMANLLNPNTSPGVFLDAIMALTGVQRNVATRTVVPGVTLNGVSGTVVPEGSQAATATGTIFRTLADVTITGGVATVDFRAVDFGPIGCNPGTLTQIIGGPNGGGIVGWETVTNPNTGVLGRDVQSDESARAKRLNTMEFQGSALLLAAKSALWNIPEVVSVFPMENVESSSQTINGISVAANSVWFGVKGGSNLEVASALLENKSGGCKWDGTTPVSIVEPASGQTYTVKFTRPTDVPILFRVTSPNGNLARVQDAILKWAAGEITGYAGFKIGNKLSTFEVASAINALYPDIEVYKVEQTLASAPSSWTTDIRSFTPAQMGSTVAASISVVTP